MKFYLMVTPDGGVTPVGGIEFNTDKKTAGNFSAEGN